jgi:BirA family transcriptional regulator, biotin operon repressor / biotin---[acetyl-CoA-carboxylase] ligase
VKPLDISRIRETLPDTRIDYYPSIGSTMAAAEGLPFGSIAIAEEQTSGQGRHGHAWHSEPGAGIYFSIVLEPTPTLTLALGLAAQEAVREASGIECDIRWPNDLMLNDMKTGGILVQASLGKAVAGIGINVGHTCFPPDLIEQATSLAMWASASGMPCPERERILISLIGAIRRFAPLDRDSVLRLFTTASSYVSGRRVTVDEGGRAIEGITAGLDPSGFLRVRKDDGTDTLILAGGVRAART